MGDRQVSRSLTSAALLQDCMSQCPELFPKAQGSMTVVDIQVSQEGTPTFLTIYGDQEVEGYIQHSAPRFLGLLSCYKLLKNSFVQIQMKVNSVEFSTLIESCFQGVVDELLEECAIVKAGKMKVAVRTRFDFEVGVPCKVVRDPFLHFVGEEAIGAQIDFQSLYPYPANPQGYDQLAPASNPSHLQPSDAQYNVGASSNEQVDLAQSHGYGQSSPLPPQVQPSESAAFQQAESAHYLPPEEASQYPAPPASSYTDPAPPASFYTDPLPPVEASQYPAPPASFYSDPVTLMEIDLDPLLDVSDIDVETYPQTCGEKRLPLRSLINCSKWNKDQIGNALLLAKKYTHWRRSRGDGNCYYRAVAIGYLEHLCRISTSKKEFHRFYLNLFGQKSILLASSLLPYLKVFIKHLKGLYTFKDKGQALPMLQTMFQDPYFDLGAVATFRMIARKWLFDNREHDDVMPFLLDSGVEAPLAQMARMGEEAEGVTFLAMANALDAKIVHVTLSAGGCREDTFTPFAPGRKLVLHILLKPGHYDALYPVAAQMLDRYSYSNDQFCENPAFIWQIEGLFEEVKARE